VGVLLGIWGILGGRIAAIVCSASFFYLAWYVSKIPSNGSAEALVTTTVQATTARWRQRLLLGAVVTGCVIGAAETYVRFSGLGWSHAGAAGVALALSAGVGILAWMLGRRMLGGTAPVEG
jgi:hypothetical protein